MNLLNLGGLNSYITYITRNPQWCQKLSHKRREFLEDLGLDLVKPMMERRAMSFVGLSQYSKPCLFVASHQQLLLITAKMSKVQQNLRERDTTDALWIESLLGSAQSAKKLFVPPFYQDRINQMPTSMLDTEILCLFRKPAPSARNAKNCLCPV